MDIRYIAWAGHQFEESGTGETVVVTVDAGDPVMLSEEVGEVDIDVRELKPKLRVFPAPSE